VLALYVISVEKFSLYELMYGFDSSVKGQELNAKAKNPCSKRSPLIFRES